MGKKLVLAITMLILLLVADVALGEVSVGVKKGDWIEYNVTTTGTPEEGHDVTWARMEILSVQGKDISVNVVKLDPKPAEENKNNGGFTFRLNLQPQQKITINLSYYVEYPTGKRVSGLY
jgi:hypothetical protein